MNERKCSCNVPQCSECGGKVVTFTHKQWAEIRASLEAASQKARKES